MTARACPFASKTVTEHLLRGAGAAGLIALAVWLVHAPAGWPTVGAVAAGAGAVALMRGCPTCWLTGLFATLAARSRRRAEAAPQIVLAGAAAPASPSAGSRPSSVPAPR